MKSLLSAGSICLALYAAGGLALPTEVSAQTSKEYALMGKKAWAAFQCAALASQNV